MSLLEQLNKLADAEYKAFNKKIIPTKQVVLGVRLPALRKIAKDICRNNPKDFLAANKNNIFEDSKVIICPVCKKEFSPNNSNRRYCYDCSPIGLSPADRIRYLKRVIKNILIQEKGGKCEICGYNNCLGALDFHHLNPSEKDYNISKSLTKASNFD